MIRTHYSETLEIQPISSCFFVYDDILSERSVLAVIVIKRDGSVVDYDRSKIITAIEKANAEVSEEDRLPRDRVEAIVDHIEHVIRKRTRILVEDIQDLVEQGLVAENKFNLSKTYIIYRYNRALVRKANTTDESIPPC